MIDRNYIDIFIDGLKRYFSHLDLPSKGDKGSLKVGAPYLLERDQSIGLDYTGMISISGNNTGYVFFSARNALLRFILLSYGESRFDEIYKRDLVGEVANILAGNARKKFGVDFHISTPTVLEGKINPQNYSLNSRCYVLPVRWKSNKAELIISI